MSRLACFRGRIFGGSRLLLFLVVLLLLVLLGGVALEIGIRTAPLPAGLFEPPPETTLLLDRKGGEIAVVANVVARDCRPLPLAMLGDWLPMATVLVEDARFFRHPGVDPMAMAGAVVRSVRAGRMHSGASTITQQLIKLASGRRDRRMLQKGLEMLSALRLEREWDKEKILEAYLNRLDYGNRRIGPEAAALAYFGKSARDLSPSEAIYLAGLPQAPGRLNPWNDPNPALQRFLRHATRLDAMKTRPAEFAQGKLLPPKPGGASSRSPSDAASPPMAFQSRRDVAINLLHVSKMRPKPGRYHPPQRAPHFVDALRSRGLLEGASGAVRTTLDLEMQEIVERLLAHHFHAVRGWGIRDAAVVIVDNRTGEVRALASEGIARFINAADTPKSSGSTLKPFLYTEAIDRRILTAASLLPDTPDAIRKVYPDYDPKNYTRRYLGPVRVREALGNSLNVPAVVTVAMLGARQSFARLREWGFALPGGFDASGAGFILGNTPVTCVELAGAFSALARGGVAWPVRFLPRADGPVSVVASEEACAIVADILCDNRARATSFGTASPLALPWRTAAKTGTSSGFRDAWCAGFTADHSVVVWAGALDGRPMPEVLAVRSAAPLWAAIMRALYGRGDRPVPPAPVGEKLVRVGVDPRTGLLPLPKGPVVEELFLAGTEPREGAAAWLDGEVLLLPTAYAAWCAGPGNRIGARVRQDKLEILFPADGARFSLSGSIAAHRQAFRPQANASDVEWWVNGRRVEGDSISLERGQHTLKARSQGQEAGVVFSVE